MNAALDVELITYGQARVDGGRRCAPVLVDLEAAGPGDDLLAEGRHFAVAPFAGKADVDRQRVAGLEHLADVILAGGAGSCVGTGTWGLC